MKTPPSTPLPRLFAAALLLSSSLPAAAQSAEGFDTSGMVPAEAKPAPAPAAVAVANPVLANTDLEPSRYAGDEVSGYVRTLSSRFSIRKRMVDPFGRYQDPDFKAPEPLMKKPRTGRELFKPEPPTPFADIIAGIPVNIVIPEKQSFVIGDRTFKIGNLIPIQLPNGKQVKVQVTTVTSSRITFRNVESGESAILTLNMRPAGMSKGTGGISAPGMEPTGSDAPIQIEPSSLPPISSNR